MMNAAEHIQTVTEFARNPAKTLRKIDKGDIILRRTKGKAPIRLTLASHAEESASGLDVLSRALMELLRELKPAATVIMTALERQHPWMKFLPEDGRGKFASEFIETLAACASISNFAPLTQLVNGWKSTAEIYADPELFARLREDAPAASGKAVVRP
jgi:hypothetical protein